MLTTIAFLLWYANYLLPLRAWSFFLDLSFRLSLSHFSFFFSFPAVIAFLSSSLFPSCYLSFFSFLAFLVSFPFLFLSLSLVYPSILLSFYPSIPCSFLPWYISFPFIWLSLAFSSFHSIVYLANHYLSVYRIITAFYEILYNLIIFITYNDTTSDAMTTTQ